MNCPTYVLDFSKKLMTEESHDQTNLGNIIYYICLFSVTMQLAFQNSNIQTHTQITFFKPALLSLMGFPCSSASKESACDAGDPWV